MEALKDISAKSKAEFAKHRLNVLRNFRNPPIVEVSEIPLVRTRFPNTQDSWWYLSSTNEKETVIFYELGANEVFNTHIHLSKEFLQPLTQGCKLEWVTERAIEYKTFGDTFSALAGEKHALVNLSSFRVKFKIIWTPRMIGWAATFVELKNKNNFKNK